MKTSRQLSFCSLVIGILSTMEGRSLLKKSAMLTEAISKQRRFKSSTRRGCWSFIKSSRIVAMKTALILSFQSLSVNSCGEPGSEATTS